MGKRKLYRDLLMKGKIQDRDLQGTNWKIIQ